MHRVVVAAAAVTFIIVRLMIRHIGKNVESVLPGQFWARLTNKLGNQPYVKQNGEDTAVLNAVQSIAFCLQDRQCSDVPFDL